MPTARSLRPSYLLAVIFIALSSLIVLDRLMPTPITQAVVATLYQWLLLLGGAGLLLGLANVAWLHMRRVLRGQRDWVLSLILVVVMAAVFVAGVINPAGAASPLLTWVFDHVIAPGQAALFALLALVMAAAAYRFVHVGRPGGAWLLAGVLLILVVQMPMSSSWLPGWLVSGAFWLVDTPVMAALRGALIGSGIALLIVGLRLLLGRA
jgi:hypothetical protein